MFVTPLLNQIPCHFKWINRTTLLLISHEQEQGRGLRAIRHSEACLSAGLTERRQTFGMERTEAPSHHPLSLPLWATSDAKRGRSLCHLTWVEGGRRKCAIHQIMRTHNALLRKDSTQDSCREAVRLLYAWMRDSRFQHSVYSYSNCLTAPHQTKTRFCVEVCLNWEQSKNKTVVSHRKDLRELAILKPRH